MKNLTAALVIALASLSMVGCANMTPTQKKWTAAGVGVLVVGAYAAHRADNGGDMRAPTAQAAQCVDLGCKPIM